MPSPLKQPLLPLLGVCFGNPLSVLFSQMRLPAWWLNHQHIFRTPRLLSGSSHLRPNAKIFDNKHRQITAVSAHRPCPAGTPASSAGRCRPATLVRSWCHPLPEIRSTTQQPRTWSPGWRQWFSISALPQPASSRASARTARRAASSVPAGRMRLSEAAVARARTVGVCHAGSMVMWLKGFPKMSRTKAIWATCSASFGVPVRNSTANPAALAASHGSKPPRLTAIRAAKAALNPPHCFSSPSALVFRAAASASSLAAKAASPAVFRSRRFARPSANRSATSTAIVLRLSPIKDQMRRQQATVNNRFFRSLAFSVTKSTIPFGSVRASQSCSLIAIAPFTAGAVVRTRMLLHLQSIPVLTTILAEILLPRPPPSRT